MKKTLFLLCNLLIISELAISQSITLAPTNPASPTKGTVVFDNALNQLKYWNGTAYIPVTNAAAATGWGLAGANLYTSNNVSNVGIGTTTPVNQLQIGATPSFSGNHLAIGNGTQAMSISQIPAASVWYSNTAFSLMPYVPQNANSGYLGIGTSSPSYPITLRTPSNTNSWGLLHSDGTVEVGEYIFTNAAAEIGTRSNHPFYIFANDADNPPAIKIGVDSKVGIVSPSNPTNQLQIGSVGATGFSGNQIAFGDGTRASGISQTSTVSQWLSTTDISLMPQNNGNGHVGIDTQSPVNTLQIGSVGNYNGNHIAFGNGTGASGLAQTGSLMTWNSTTDMAFMPRGNGHGRVGINTTTPLAPLDVEDYVIFPANGLITYLNDDHQNVQSGNISPAISIYAAQNVIAIEFDAASDARIKNIIDKSDAKKDLETLNKIKITDYRMKDFVKNGNKTFKKVIAQEVEEVYPQVVNRSTNFIPNVYQPTFQIQQKGEGFSLCFNDEHHISKDAKLLQLYTKKGNERLEILSIPSPNEVILKAESLSDTVFVYGEQVNDFRTVDYEGLTTLNISATQELSKLVKDLQKKNEELERKLEKQNARLEKIEALLTKTNQ